MTYTPDPAATYTTNYSLEKPSHGSHDGTWEQWIASAFDMIDAAIHGAETAVPPHAASHKTGGTDALTAVDVGAEPAITTLSPTKGGTGATVAPSAGQILVGKTDGTYTPINITAGQNVTVTPGSGTLEIAAGGGSGTNQITTLGTNVTSTIIPAFSVLSDYNGGGLSEGWHLADLSSYAGTIGMNLVDLAASRADTQAIVLQGVVENPAWTLTQGLNYYAGISGSISTTADRSHPRFVGVALSPTKLYFCPNWAVDSVYLPMFWEGAATAGEALGNRCWIRYNAATGQWFSAHCDTVANCSGLIGRSTASYASGDTVSHVQIGGVITIDNSEAGNAIGSDWYLKSSQQPGLTPVKPAIARLVGHLIAGYYGGSNIYTILIDPSPSPETVAATPAIDALAAPTDITNLNVSTSAHGLCPKLPGNTTSFLRGDGTYAAPSAGTGTSVTRIAPITKSISIATTDAATGKQDSVGLLCSYGQISRIRVRADWTAGQQSGAGAFLVNNAAGILLTDTTIAIDTGSAGFTLAAGDLVQIDNEIILCGIGTSATSIAAATRGYAGTVATVHDDNAQGYKCNDGLRLELFASSARVPAERLLRIGNIMTMALVTDAAISAGDKVLTFTGHPTAVSDFGRGSLVRVVDTVSDLLRVQDAYGALTGTGLTAAADSITTYDAATAHAITMPVQRVIEYDIPVPFKFVTGTTLYLTLTPIEKITTTVNATIEFIVDEFGA